MDTQLSRGGAKSLLPMRSIAGIQLKCDSLNASIWLKRGKFSHLPTSDTTVSSCTPSDSLLFCLLLCMYFSQAKCLYFEAKIHHLRYHHRDLPNSTQSLHDLPDWQLLYLHGNLKPHFDISIVLILRHDYILPYGRFELLNNDQHSTSLLTLSVTSSNSQHMNWKTRQRT